MDMDQKLYRISFTCSYYVTRPLARRFLPLPMKLGIKPNQVTAGSSIILLIGLGLLAVGGYWFRVGGATSVLLSYFLDCVDGELARKTGQTSEKGGYLDGIGGYLQAAFLLPAVGVGLSRAPDMGNLLITRFMEFPAWACAGIGLWAGLVLLLCKLINLRYRYIFGTSMRHVSKGVLRLATIPHGLLMPVLLVGAAAQILSFVLVAYAAYHSAELLYGLYKAIKA